MEENMTQDTFKMDEIKSKVEEQLKIINEQGITSENLNDLYKLIDIHKDIANEHYWKIKEEKYMMYRAGGSYNRGGYGEYGNYNDGGYGDGNYGRRRRDSRGRYTEGGSYGRRYRGQDLIEEMSDHFNNYMDGKEGGNYGGPEITKALDYLLKSMEEFMTALKEDASSQEEVEKIKRTARKISDV